MIIAIDGPAASGKGTLGKKLAAHYGFRHLDTGLLYRAVAKALLDTGHAANDEVRAIAAAKAIDPARFDEAALKRYEVGEAASVVSIRACGRCSTSAGVCRGAPGAVLDGRDIGTGSARMPSEDFRSKPGGARPPPANELRGRGESVERRSFRTFPAMSATAHAAAPLTQAPAHAHQR
jgi:cytidylate kinase